MRRVFLVCGYKWHGKDHLARNGTSSYVILSKKKNESLPLDFEKTLHLKFAQHLKQYVLPFIGYTTPENYEAEKDLQSVLPVKGSIRDYLIGIAKASRDLDPDFFVKMLAESLNATSQDVIITDWRYPNEYEFLRQKDEVLTIRVHRAEIPVPESEVISEHSLDFFETDFLLVPVENMELHLEAARQLLPQYFDYS